jgi:hypothetical protein
MRNSHSYPMLHLARGYDGAMFFDSPSPAKVPILAVQNANSHFGEGCLSLTIVTFFIKNQ